MMLTICWCNITEAEELPKTETVQTNTRPVITQAIHVKSLSREEAKKNLPVKIRGVITARLGYGFVIQDETWSVFMRLKNNIMDGDHRPEVGDFVEIEGVTDVGYAPYITAERGVYLGAGIFPKPLKPSWDELFNGSMDTQYVEIEGVVSRIEQDGLTLLTRAGKIRIELVDENMDNRIELDGARIRIRGVFSPARGGDLMMVPRLRLSTASIIVDQPAPESPFEIPLKHAEDLFLFDVQADLLRRVRLSGKVLQEWNGQHFLLDEDNGFRAELKTPEKLHPGDLVELVGFPDFSGFSPVLLDALVRKTGTSALPAAQPLSTDNPLLRNNDAKRVRVESDLTGISEDRNGQVLELRAGNRWFIARLKSSDGRLKDILPGSRLLVSGTYIGKGSGRDVESFELLLNSPADITVLKRPSWWTAQHALNLAGALALFGIGSLSWIIMLRRQVDTRTRQLAVEIHRREQTEQRRALEEERTRIAQDLHDDLGATLTEIRFLTAVGSVGTDVAPEIRDQFMEVSEKSRQMVASLDEIVWAVNPENDSLMGLESYLHHVVDEFFRRSPIRCRLDVDDALPEIALHSDVRHNLYLAVREALNNVAKHSYATEAWLRIHWKAGILCMTVEDNGCGFCAEEEESPGNGLRNMRRRLDKLSGHFECESSPGTGTICRMSVRLEKSER
ncbi:MAG: sensor histidine kinase [Pontiellaceae bacterium]|nr:sensor histidine kinase [Pontiellaceae bacterium]MBN2783690.1 sensor histidine kinase [Pontiellaceae bacterium]